MKTVETIVGQFTLETFQELKRRYETRQPGKPINNPAHTGHKLEHEFARYLIEFLETQFHE